MSYLTLSFSTRLVKAPSILNTLQNYYIVIINLFIVLLTGNEGGNGKAWGCDLSYKYVEINAEYTT